jgi:adenine-specific DNA-methyltransferase
MAAKKKTKPANTPIESIVHEERRSNIPTADAHDLVTSEIEKVETLRYPRNPDLDPQLVWKGKDEQDGADLVVDVPPIYIQEKIDPRVLIENLRDTALKPEDEPELKLFEAFDDLDEMASVEFYQHESKWSNRMILGDSLQVMASLAERERLRGKVQMVYFDPPYGIKFGSNWQVSMRDRGVPDKLENRAREVEVVKAFRDTWSLGINSYLAYLRDRLTIARDLLTESGSIFVQIGDANEHLARSLLDEIFGSGNFVSAITFRKTSPLGASLLANVADYLLWYAKDKSQLKFRSIYRDKTFGAASTYTWVELPDGSRRKMSADERRMPTTLPTGSRPFALDNLRSSGFTETCYFPIELDGVTYPPQKNSWATNRQGVDRLKTAGRLQGTKTLPYYVRFFDDFPVAGLTNIWTDTRGEMEMTYVVQTSRAVLERCVLMSSDPGDLVIDPTCGSGTTAFVAEQHGRRWITIDSSRVALALAKQRLLSAKFPYYYLSDTPEGRAKESSISGKPVDTSPTSGRVDKGFVYERVPHITLGSIAQNPDIKEGMSKEEIDAVIARSAEFEFLYDKPYEDKSKVRVSGPFTVESLSPHRALGFVTHLDDSDDPAMQSVEEFNSMILENLDRAGIQNGLKKERLEFEGIDPHPGVYVNAVGTEKTESGDGGKKVALAIGPQYGTVSPKYVKEATREAQQIPDVSVLAILGFAFDPAVVSLGEDVQVVDDVAAIAKERKLGKLNVVMVRMNTDLLMGEDLKKTGAGNLFVVSGEPDIDISEDGDKVVVEIKGVDVYDPNTDRVRSRGTDRIALWMIDTNYNGESFFVRHCYFPGGYDWYKSLKKALKAEIDEATWDTLNKTVSRPFAKPETGKIAIKVINDYGDEVMQVYDVN